jgi:hypothetical protein
LISLSLHSKVFFTRLKRKKSRRGRKGGREGTGSDVDKAKLIGEVLNEVLFLRVIASTQYISLGINNN